MKFTVETPGYFDILLTCPGYSCKQPDSVYIANNGARSITIPVVSLNNPPVAKAGRDFYVMVGDPVWLDASESYDPDGDALTYTWEDSKGGCDTRWGLTKDHIYQSG